MQRDGRSFLLHTLLDAIIPGNLWITINYTNVNSARQTMEQLGGALQGSCAPAIQGQTLHPLVGL